MALTKVTVAAQASASNTAGSTTTGSWINVGSSTYAAYKMSLLAKVTNGGTGPTVGCTVRVDLSPDNGTTVYTGAGGSYLAGTANSGVYAASFDLPEDTMYVRVAFTGNTGQTVTVQSDLTLLTAL